MMGFYSVDLVIAGDGVTIIYQQPYPHTAVVRLDHGLRQQSPGFVAAKNIILKVKRAYGGIDHLHSDQEPVTAHLDLLRIRHSEGSLFRIIRAQPLSKAIARTAIGKRGCLIINSTSARLSHQSGRPYSVFYDWAAAADRACECTNGMYLSSLRNIDAMLCSQANRALE